MKQTGAGIVMLLAAIIASIAATGAARAQDAAKVDYKFDFGPGKVAAGYTQINADSLFSKEKGYGLETRPGTVRGVDAGSDDPLRSDYLTSDQPFAFSVNAPEGNYRVTVTLGDAKAESVTTVKAESRKLMLERIHTDAGKFVTRSFAVNVRVPQIAGTNEQVQLDPREVPGIWHWDDKLTITFLDSHPAVCAVEVQKVDDVITVFTIGDSTVTDQVQGNYGTWGQSLPRWFTDKVAVANYAESGETLKAFRHEKRWDKIMSVVKPGDYIFMQFGHNDLNKSGANAMWPRTDFSGDWSNTYSEAKTDYRRLLVEYANEAKARGAIPVIVSPMTKVNTGPNGATPSNGLGDYPQAARDAAADAKVPLIDLNAMSIDLHTALGPENSRRAVMDGNHSNTYGGYLLARCIVEGIKQAKLDLAKYLVEDAGNFDPKHPSPMPDQFDLPNDPGQPSLPNFGGGRGRGARGPRGARGSTAPASAPAEGR